MGSTPVIIIGLTAQGLSLLRSLSRAGIDVIAFYENKKNVGVGSRYGDKRFVAGIDELRDQMTDLVAQYGPQMLCYIASGGMLAELLVKFPELWDMCKVISGPRTTVEKMAHKDYLYGLASGCDFIIPNYRLLSDPTRDELAFPVFLKRNYEIPLFFKAARVETKEELESKYVSRLTQTERENVIIQECIPIDSHSMEITSQSFYCKGESNEFFIGWQKRKTRDGLTSYLVELEPGPLRTRIAGECSKYMRQTDYTGFAEFEFIYNPESDALYFLEINTRPCGTQSAMDYKFSNVADVLLHPDDPPALVARSNETLHWMNIVRDVRVRLQKKLLSSPGDIFRSKFDVLRMDDLKPFFRQFF